MAALEIVPNRRAFIRGAALIIASPAIVRASSLMPLSVQPKPRWVEIDPAHVDRVRHELLYKIINPPYILHEDGTLTMMDTTPALNALRSLEASPMPAAAQISPQSRRKLVWR